ncbi:MAG: Nascent polypeptide-associated complex protein [Candidatus Thorarchaeota archaeon]|nr:Nascent polypeptide-associated complex protein [Candidatus Thorarchaeota archaeon]
MGRRSSRVSSRSLTRMMKQMGIEQSEVTGVEEVIFRFYDKEWVLDDPQVIMIKQSGTESFQVSGIRSERALTKGEIDEKEIEPVKRIEVPMEDAALVASQTGVNIEVALQALKDTGGDLAAAILKLRRR